MHVKQYLYSHTMALISRNTDQSFYNCVVLVSYDTYAAISTKPGVFLGGRFKVGCGCGCGCVGSIGH